MNVLPSLDWQPIDTAPKDGRVILVMHEEVGSFAMAWNPEATNAIFAPDQVGMWEMADQTMTWNAHDGAGPSYWAPLPSTCGCTTCRSDLVGIVPCVREEAA